MTGCPRPDLFDASIASDGLTVDTPHGPVDLIAIERALAGDRLHLTRAEHKYVAALVHAHLAVYPTHRKAAWRAPAPRDRPA